MKHLSISVREGRFLLQASVLVIGPDLMVSIWGGDSSPYRCRRPGPAPAQPEGQKKDQRHFIGPDRSRAQRRSDRQGRLRDLILDL